MRFVMLSTPDSHVMVNPEHVVSIEPDGNGLSRVRTVDGHEHVITVDNTYDIETALTRRPTQ